VSHSTLLRLTGRDVLPLLHRTTTQALDDLPRGAARTTLFCDFRGRLQHRATLAVGTDGGVWLLRADAPGAELAAAIEKTVFRDDVRIEDWSSRHAVVLATAGLHDSGILGVRDDIPIAVAVGDGTLLATDDRPALTPSERITRLRPAHGSEICEEFNPFELGLANEVHLAKGCFTGQEALQRLITYHSVRRRAACVRLAQPVPSTPMDILAGSERSGVLTSAWERDGFAVLRHEAIENNAELRLADGAAVRIVAVAEPTRPIGRP